MLTIYNHVNYRDFLNEWIAAQTGKGRGMKLQFAKAAGVSSTLISLILKGDKHLSLEQAAELSEFIGLPDLEANYFLLLVEYGRAGSQRLRQRLFRQIQQHQQSAKKISHRVKKDVELSNEMKAIYYSTWLFTGVRNLVAIPEYQSVAAITRELHLPASVVSRVTDFLVEQGLCLRAKDGALSVGPAHTHLDSESPFVGKHHQNWRLKAIENVDRRSNEDLFYTCPMSLSEEAAERVRKLLPEFISQILKLVGPSTSEVAYCLNIDWFNYI